jgi:uncharacterized membrane protein
VFIRLGWILWLIAGALSVGYLVVFVRAWRRGERLPMHLELWTWRIGIVLIIAILSCLAIGYLRLL